MMRKFASITTTTTSLIYFHWYFYIPTSFDSTATNTYKCIINILSWSWPRQKQQTHVWDCMSVHGTLYIQLENIFTKLPDSCQISSFNICPKISLPTIFSKSSLDFSGLVFLSHSKLQLSAGRRLHYGGGTYLEGCTGDQRCGGFCGFVELIRIVSDTNRVVSLFSIGIPILSFRVWWKGGLSFLHLKTHHI